MMCRIIRASVAERQFGDSYAKSDEIHDNILPLPSRWTTECFRDEMRKKIESRRRYRRYAKRRKVTSQFRAPENTVSTGQHPGHLVWVRYWRIGENICGGDGRWKRRPGRTTRQAGRRAGKRKRMYICRLSERIKTERIANGFPFQSVDRRGNADSYVRSLSLSLSDELNFFKFLGSQFSNWTSNKAIRGDPRAFYDW